MNILIFGAGAVGSLFGAFLRKAGHTVALLGRPWQTDAVARGGLRVRGLWCEFRTEGFELFSTAEEIRSKREEFDLILLTVKSFDTERAVRELAPLVGKKTVVVSFQNGLGNVETILKYVKPEHYLIGRTITGVDITPGEVTVTVSADAMAVGHVPGKSSIRTPDDIAGLLRDAGIPARAVPNIMALIWAKVIYNCALNGPCSLLEIPYGEMLKTEKRRESMQDIVEECYAVAKQSRVPLVPASAVAYYELLLGKLIPKTAAHYPSMLADLRRGRRTEIDALNGYIWSMGDAAGIPTSENRRVTEAIRKMERASHIHKKA